MTGDRTGAVVCVFCVKTGVVCVRGHHTCVQGHAVVEIGGAETGGGAGH